MAQKLSVLGMRDSLRHHPMIRRPVCSVWGRRQPGLAMLKKGEKADMMAHTTGLGFGLLFGLLMSRIVLSQ
jgi:hypothetical protein